MRAGNAGGLAHFLLCLINRENQPLTPSPSNAFCHVRQERLPCLPELHQPFPGSCWAPRHREQQSPHPDPTALSTSPDLGVRGGRDPRSGPATCFVGLLLTWELISFLRSAQKHITNIDQEPHSGHNCLINTFIKIHSTPGLSPGLPAQRPRGGQTDGRPSLEELTSQQDGVGMESHWEGDLQAEPLG